MTSVDHLLALADDALVAAQRLAEWCTNAHEMEEDVALANIALDQLGAARLLLMYAGDLDGRGRDEDALAYLRTDRVPVLEHRAVLALARAGATAEAARRFCLGDAFFRPTSTGFVPETVSRARLQQANALLVLTNSSFSILGPVAAGVLVASVGPGWALAADAATFLASALFLLQIHVLPKGRRQGASFMRDLREGWHVFRSRTWLWVDGVFSALGSFAVLAPMFVLGPVVAARSLGGAPAWATIVAAFGLGSVLGGIVLLRVRPKRPLLVAIPPLALLALPVALLALPAPTPLIALGTLAGGFGLTVFNTLFETTVQRHVPSESLSRVASIDWVMSGALQPFGFALAGSAALVIGPGTTLAASALWIVVSTAIVLSIPSVRNLRSLDQ